MYASYLLDEDPSVKNILTEFDLLRGIGDDVEAFAVLSVGNEPDGDKSLSSLETINYAPAESTFVDSPSAARFLPVNAPSLIHHPTPRTFPLSRAATTHEGPHTSTDQSKLRRLIIAAADAIDKPSSEKGMAVIASVAGARGPKREAGHKKDYFIFAVAEDPVRHQARSLQSSKVVGTRAPSPQITPSTTLLGQLSEKTLNKLQAFKFVPPVDFLTPPTTNPDKGTGHSAVASEKLAYFQPDVPSADDGDSYDEFDLDENVFDNVYADYDVDCHTPGSTTLAVNDSSIEPYRGDRTPSQATPPKATPEPQLSPRTSKVSSKTIQTPLVPMSPFLRSSLPQPAPSQSVLPSLMPHRRITTLFRIAEVHRLLATLPPRAPPQRIELYAIVAFSHRNPKIKTQAFTFADLFFPRRPPYLCGTYTAWTAGELFDEDSAPFLDARNGGKLCRTIVQVAKRSWNGNASQGGSSPLPIQAGSHGDGKETDALDVEVLNIWEATWEDVEYVKGLVGA